MDDENVKNGIAKKINELFCDYDIILGLTYVLPMMEVVQTLSKMAQAKDTFVYDFVTSIRLCTTNLYSWCIDPLKRYGQPQFQTFNNLVHHIYDALHMVWWMELVNQVEYATFKFHIHLYMLHKKNSTMSVMFMVTKDNG
jgi:hypothetical protein